MWKNNNKGQSTVEYILLVTAVIAVMIAFAAGPASPFRTKLNETLTNVTDDIGVMGNRLTASHVGINAAGVDTPPAEAVIDVVNGFSD